MKPNSDLCPWHLRLHILVLFCFVLFFKVGILPLHRTKDTVQGTVTVGCFHLHKGQLSLSKLGRVLINQPATPRAGSTINPYPYVPAPSPTHISLCQTELGSDL